MQLYYSGWKSVESGSSLIKTNPEALSLPSVSLTLLSSQIWATVGFYPAVAPLPFQKISLAISSPCNFFFVFIFFFLDFSPIVFSPTFKPQDQSLMDLVFDLILSSLDLAMELEMAKLVFLAVCCWHVL